MQSFPTGAWLVVRVSTIHTCGEILFPFLSPGTACFAFVLQGF